MKVLFIGGTGIISTESSKLAVKRGIDLYHLNRGQRGITIPGVTTITGDITKPDEVRAALQGHHFDAVVDWIAFTKDHIDRDLDLFRGLTEQYIFISSASAYQKPATSPFITESTPLANPFWQYSRDKIACENRLMWAYRDEGYPITIVRPSHTYDKNIPVAIGGWDSYTVCDRIKKGLPVIVHGDGTSLWTVTHAEDFAKGFAPLLGNPLTIGHAFHITSDEVLNWNQIYAALGRALGAEPNIVHIASDFIAKLEPDLGPGLLGDKSWSVVFDNSKIKRFAQGYIATIPFHEGIKRTIAWYAAHPEKQTSQPETNALMDRIINAHQAAMG